MTHIFSHSTLHNKFRFVYLWMLEKVKLNGLQKCISSTAWTLMQTLLFWIKIILIQLILFYLHINFNTTTNIILLEYPHWTEDKFREKQQLFNYAPFHNSCKQQKISLNINDYHRAVAFYHPNTYVLKLRDQCYIFFLQLQRKTNLRLLMTVSAFGFLRRVTYWFPELIHLITSYHLIAISPLAKAPEMQIL